MEDPFLWYDWDKGRIVGLPIRDCREVTLSGSNVLEWFVRVFPAVGACLSLHTLRTAVTARLEVGKCVRKLKLMRR